MANTETITDSNPQLCPPAPAWGQLMVWEAADKKPKAPPHWGDRSPVELDLKNLDNETILWWNGTKFATAPNGQLDRSNTLFTIGRLLAKQGYDGSTIASALADRDIVLGYNKFSRRKDGGTKGYTDIAIRVTTPTPGKSLPKAPAESATPPNPRLLQYHKQVGIPGHGVREVIVSHLRSQRDVLTNYYKKKGDDASLRLADRVEHCFTYYIELVCQKTQIAFVRRFKCNDINCSICALSLISSFFKSKEGALQAHLTSPAVYRIYLGSLDLPVEEGSRDDLIRAAYKRVGNMMTHLRDNLGKVLDIAANNCRGVRCSIKANTLHLELVLMGNAASDTVDSLEKFFAKEMGHEVLVFENECTDVQSAIEVFRGLMSIRVVWENPRDYEVWRGATKGMKLVQGRGSLYKVSGSTPKKLSVQEATHLNLNCDVCSDCHPLVKGWGYHPIDTTQVIQKHSPWNGRTYSVILEAGGFAGDRNKS